MLGDCFVRRDEIRRKYPSYPHKSKKEENENYYYLSTDINYEDAKKKETSRRKASIILLHIISVVESSEVDTCIHCCDKQ